MSFICLGINKLQYVFTYYLFLHPISQSNSLEKNLKKQSYDLFSQSGFVISWGCNCFILLATSLYVGAINTSRIVLFTRQNHCCFQSISLPPKYFPRLLRCLSMPTETDIAALKVMNQDFVKFYLFDGTDFTLWQEQMKFLLIKNIICFGLDLQQFLEPAMRIETISKLIERNEKRMTRFVEGTFWTLFLNDLQPFQFSKVS